MCYWLRLMLLTANATIQLQIGPAQSINTVLHDPVQTSSLEALQTCKLQQMK